MRCALAIMFTPLGDERLYSVSTRKRFITKDKQYNIILLYYIIEAQHTTAAVVWLGKTAAAVSIRISVYSTMRSCSPAEIGRIKRTRTSGPGVCTTGQVLVRTHGLHKYECGCVCVCHIRIYYIHLIHVRTKETRLLRWSIGNCSVLYLCVAIYFSHITTVDKREMQTDGDRKR